MAPRACRGATHLSRRTDGSESRPYLIKKSKLKGGTIGKLDEWLWLKFEETRTGGHVDQRQLVPGFRRQEAGGLLIRHRFSHLSSMQP